MSLQELWLRGAPTVEISAAAPGEDGADDPQVAAEAQRLRCHIGGCPPRAGADGPLNPRPARLNRRPAPEVRILWHPALNAAILFLPNSVRRAER